MPPRLPGIIPSRQAHEGDGGGLPGVEARLPLNETNLDWWASDQESPYTEVKRFDWYRGYHVGGRSLMWGRQSYRWSDFDFEANVRDGIATDWPIRYADISPWYDYVERHAGSPDRRKGWHNFRTDNFNRRCRSTAARS